MTNPIIRPLWFAVVMYLVLLGATWNGVLLPAVQPFTLALFAGGALLWFIAQRRVSLARTPLDGLLPLWGVVIVISILANPATAHRSVEAVWYLLLYALVWYWLALFLTRGMKRIWIGDSLLIAGIIVVAVGYLQLVNTITLGTYLNARPGSLIGNPNSLGAFLLALLPYSIVRTLLARGWWRWCMGVYALAIGGMLVATFSRGAWIGLGVQMLALTLLWLAHLDLLHPAKLRAWFNGLKPQWRRMVVGGIGMVMLGAAVLGLLLLRSFQIGGREASFRTRLWQTALTIFSERPLTGWGLFTYGYHLPRFDSIPPEQPLAHAHSLPLNIAAELGVLGLVVLAISLFIVVWAAWRNFKALAQQERGFWIAGAAALIGYGTHHFLDTPIMMPLLALIGVALLAATILPITPQLIPFQWQRVWRWGLVGVWGIWLGVGVWGYTLYQQYYAVLQEVAKTQNYRASAAALQPVIEADPRQPTYHLQQGFLYGLAASEGETIVLPAAIASYEAYLALEPNYAPAWSNLAALYWQTGNTESAQTAIEQAILLAPQWGIYQRQQQIYRGEAIPEDIVPPESLWNGNMARFQFLRDVLDSEHLPQVGWGSQHR